MNTTSWVHNKDIIVDILNIFGFVLYFVTNRFFYVKKITFHLIFLTLKNGKMDLEICIK